MAKDEYADYMKEVEKWNANHGKKRMRIGQTDVGLVRNRDENGYMDRKYVEKTR